MLASQGGAFHPTVLFSFRHHPSCINFVKCMVYMIRSVISAKKATCLCTWKHMLVSLNCSTAHAACVHLPPAGGKGDVL
jgi:hypothetical protein